MTHSHECVCGTLFPCVINILPIEGGGRIRCERIYESICRPCLDSMVEHASEEDLVSMAEVLKDSDPLGFWRIRERLKKLNGG
jgi:hypothetical protein